MNFYNFVLYAIILVSQWFVYQKMGREGWEGIVPFYNSYVLFEVLYGNGWRFLLVLVPFYGIYILVKAYVDLAHAFNKGSGFGVGLLLLGFIFMPILAFSNDIQYQDGRYSVNVDSNTFGFRQNEAASAEVLRKYKELLDNGAISQEEYDKKKRDILG